jgi:hypothetical protein
LLIALIGCSSQSQADQPRARDVCAAARKVSPPLVLYESPGGGFSAALPRAPTGKQDKQTDTRVDLLDEKAIYIARRVGSSFALIAFGVDASLDKLRDGGAAEVQGSIEREERIRCGEAPGREFVALSKTRKAASRTRVFIARSGVYFVSFTTLRGNERSTLATAFLDSFRIP